MRGQQVNKTALILRNDAELSIQFTVQAYKVKEEALVALAGIGKVSDASGNANAVEALRQTALCLKTIEQARVACKEPVLKFGKAIDDAAKAFTEELRNEQFRVNTLVGNFQQLERAKAQAAAKAEQERVNALERERQQELAKATSHEELDKAQEKFDILIQQQAPPIVVATKAAGQTVKDDIEFEVFDIDALYRSKPGCVSLTEKKVEIKALLKAGLQLPGVRCWISTKVSVSTRQSSPIDI